MDDLIQTLINLIPPHYIGLVVLALAVVKILDEIVRLIPDKWLAAHTTFQAIVNGVKWLAGKLGKAKVPAALVLVVALGGAFYACAPGLDGARQAVSNGTRSAAAFDDALRALNEQEEASLTARFNAAPDQATVEAIRVDRSTWRKNFDGTRAAVAAFDVTVTATSAAIALADSGQRASVDVGQLLGQLASQALDVAKRIEALRALIASHAAPDGGVK